MVTLVARLGNDAGAARARVASENRASKLIIVSIVLEQRERTKQELMHPAMRLVPLQRSRPSLLGLWLVTARDSLHCLEHQAAVLLLLTASDVSQAPGISMSVSGCHPWHSGVWQLCGTAVELSLGALLDPARESRISVAKQFRVVTCPEPSATCFLCARPRVP
jgi:hypothetical protein